MYCKVLIFNIILTFMKLVCITIIFAYIRIKTGSYGIYTRKTQYFFIF